jgi:hypothetical protein
VLLRRERTRGQIVVYDNYIMKMRVSLFPASEKQMLTLRLDSLLCPLCGTIDMYRTNTWPEVAEKKLTTLQVMTSDGDLNLVHLFTEGKSHSQDNMTFFQDIDFAPAVIEKVC